MVFHPSILTPVEQSRRGHTHTHPTASRQLHAGIRNENPLAVRPRAAATGQLRGAVVRPLGIRVVRLREPAL
eukprot:2400810-Alexandrium_andersonii.AAC.1